MIPEWFDNNFFNVEDLLIDMFSRLLPDVNVGCWVADDWLDDAEPEPELLFFRLPGDRVDVEKNSDICHIQVVAVSPNRNDSWKMIDFCRSILLPMQGFRLRLSSGGTALLWCSSDIAGPQLLTPGQQIDNRVVSSVISIRVGMRSRKRYDQILTELLG